MYICQVEKGKKERTASQWPFTTSITKTEQNRTEKNVYIEQKRSSSPLASRDY